jgi:DNA-binding transcriptional LysR family regulator
MELRQLEYFVAVAEEANFTRAAERVHISQSGVSAQVRALESELGADLFDRSGRSATLTPAGIAALPHARAALHEADDLRKAIDEVNGLVRGRLVAGMIKGCEITSWFGALAAFHDEHPGIDLELREDNSDVLVAEVRAGTQDIALVGIAGDPPPGLQSEVIISEGLAAIVDRTHPLAGRREIPVAELFAYPLVTLPAGTGIRGVLDQAGGKGKAHIALEASSPTAVADLGVRGLGVAVLSQSMADGLAGDSTVAIPITGTTTPALLALVWRPQRSPAVAAFVTHCRAAFR